MSKLVILFLLWVLGVPLSVSAGQINAFIYHRFDDDRYPSTNISLKVFEEQLRYVRQNKLTVVSVDDVARRITEGKPLPEEGILLTVDDAYSSFYDAALPVIRRYGVPVTLFVNTDAVGTPGYMSWDKIGEAVDAGVELGNHTASHAYLVELAEDETRAQWHQRVRADILKAQAAFERELGMRPEVFAYPYGEYSVEVTSLLKELGFVAAFAQQSGVIVDGHDPFILPRFPMGGPYATLDEFTSKAAMKALKVEQQQPVNPVLAPGEDNPPVLVLRLPEMVGEKAVLNCFVQGDNRCHVEMLPEKGEGWYRVVAESRLSGRRNKYTLTGQDTDGRWLWFSQLWINATNPVSSEP